jgi:hypothetical protein
MPRRLYDEQGREVVIRQSNSRLGFVFVIAVVVFGWMLVTGRLETFLGEIPSGTTQTEIVSTDSLPSGATIHIEPSVSEPVFNNPVASVPESQAQPAYNEDPSAVNIEYVPNVPAENPEWDDNGAYDPGTFSPSSIETHLNDAVVLFRDLNGDGTVNDGEWYTGEVKWFLHGYLGTPGGKWLTPSRVGAFAIWYHENPQYTITVRINNGKNTEFPISDGNPWVIHHEVQGQGYEEDLIHIIVVDLNKIPGLFN